MKLRDNKSKEKFCTLVEPFDALNKGIPDTNHGLVRIYRHKFSSDLLPINWNTIYSAAHLVPEICVVGKPKIWFLNSTVDLQLFFDCVLNIHGRRKWLVLYCRHVLVNTYLSKSNTLILVCASRPSHISIFIPNTLPPVLMCFRYWRTIAQSKCRWRIVPILMPLTQHCSAIGAYCP